MKLTGLKYVFLDCQTTGLSPQKDDILEIGWATSLREKAKNELLLPKDIPSLHSVSKTVWEMTGLSPQEVEKGADSGEVWKKILNEANGAKAAVIHYAQFETSFLRHLHKKTMGEEIFPWEILCTYKLAQRLCGDLPARTLRAVSGHLGLVLPETHRSKDHIVATQNIWQKLIELLREKEGITQWEELQAWLKTKPAKPKNIQRKYLVPKETRLAFPDKPGVYEMLAQDKQILYIGKATSLHSRVNSYFRTKKSERAMLKELMTQVADIKVTVTETPLEAALFENDRIKAVQPRYNSSLRTKAVTPVFISPDLKERSEIRQEKLPWGPFFSSNPFESTELLLSLGKDLDELSPYAFPSLSHEPEDLKEALRKTLDVLGHEKEDFEVKDLLRFGKRLSKEREPEEEVEAAVYRKLRHAPWTLHWSRWILWLMEASVFWKPKGQKQWRFLRLSAGDVVQSGYVHKVPFPKRRERVPLSSRQRDLSRHRHDRLRILVTELSNLEKRGTPIIVQFSKTRVFRANRKKASRLAPLLLPKREYVLTSQEDSF